MKTKVIILVGFVFLTWLKLIANERLGIFVDLKRYLDDNKNTAFVIDYQVPYKNLMFLSRDNSYFAELKVKFSIANADSVIINKEFINNIGVTKKYDVTTSSKSYLDRISLTLAKPGFKLMIDFEDVNANTSYTWTYVTEQLDFGARLSDIELLTKITSDTLSFSYKYKRNGMIHIPEPSGLISKDIYDSVYLYCEAYDIDTINNRAVLTLKKEDTVYQISSLPINGTATSQSLVFPINISNLDSGKYHVTIELLDAVILYDKELDFIITEQTESLYFLFTDPEDEYQLIRYIASIKSTSNWNTMSKEAKRRYISNFWISLALQVNQTVEDVLKIYKQRVDYTNARFSHFEKGWKSDMGRIYIRNGAPGDIDDDTTTDETRFVRKDFQIWKYSGKNKAVYVFVDIPMNGNFKLVYASNDEQESTLPNWRRYLGTDFDESRLNN